jgi:hypothetical protein
LPLIASESLICRLAPKRQVVMTSTHVETFLLRA